jgi:hypothetical protein
MARPVPMYTMKGERSASMGKRIGAVYYGPWLQACLSFFFLLMGALGVRDHDIGQTIMGFALGAALLIGAVVVGVRQR